MQEIKSPTHPCIGCIYFKACGETNRTMPCEGRITKAKRKRRTRNKMGFNEIMLSVVGLLVGTVFGYIIAVLSSKN